jgi:hypothetical protein
MKLWAVVIGKKGRHKQYVSCFTFMPTSKLQIFETRAEARRVREAVKVGCGHKDVCVLPFVPDAGKEQRCRAK